MNSYTYPERALTAAEFGIMEGLLPPLEKRVTHENWQLPPYNRWSFQHIREVLPTVTVERGHAPVAELHHYPMDLDDIAVKLPYAGCQKTVLSALEALYTDGFIVIHKGHVVYERYFNDMTPSSLHLSQSVGKSFVGTICGILADRGVIDLQKPLGEIVPELAHSGYKDASLRHVLDMRSGVRFDETYTNSCSDVAMMEPACGWAPWREGAANSTLEMIPPLPKVKEHGGDFEYRSIETDVMAWSLEVLTGKRLAQLTSEEIWQPMGAEQDACWTVDRAGYAMGSGGLNACLRDYARLGLLYLNDGKSQDGKQIIPAGWVRETRQDGDPDVFASHYKEHFECPAYKNQFWVRDVNNEQIMARGVFGQLIYIDPTIDLVVANLATWPEFTNVGYSLDTLAIVDALAAALNSEDLMFSFSEIKPVD